MELKKLIEQNAEIEAWKKKRADEDYCDFRRMQYVKSVHRALEKDEEIRKSNRVTIAVITVMAIVCLVATFMVVAEVGAAGFLIWTLFFVPQVALATQLEESELKYIQIAIASRD